MRTPAELGVAFNLPMPVGAGLTLDPFTGRVGPHALIGGSPTRILALSEAGERSFDEVVAGPVSTTDGGRMARTLTDSGLAHPRWANRDGASLTVTIVVPVRDRVDDLKACLQAIGESHPVVVVDDGSRDPESISALCDRFSVTLLRRPVNAGPAAARNTALFGLSSDVVAFLDSDCVPDPQWIEHLLVHFADPLVAAVAPRIVGLDPGAFRVALDMGARPASVRPMTRVPYVPTAALLVRRSVLGTGFDEGLRYGEDVDLVWRLVDAGWRVRYEPSVSVTHREPSTLRGHLGRRFHYGTSAGPLAQRHRGQLSHLVLQPFPTAVVAALCTRRARLGVGLFALSWLRLRRRLHRSHLPAHGTARPLARGVSQTGFGIARSSVMFAWPLLWRALWSRRGPRADRWWRRLLVLALVGAPALSAWREAEAVEDAPRFCAGVLAEDVAYGAGVYWGCLRSRSLSPLVPKVQWSPLSGTERRPGEARPA